MARDVAQQLVASLLALEARHPLAGVARTLEAENTPASASTMQGTRSVATATTA
jgi:hypothetical protein